MNTEDLLQTLREEAKEHTPDLRERVLSEAASPAPAQGEVLVKTKKKGLLLIALGVLVCVLLVTVLFLLQPRGGQGSLYKLVVSINPSVEFTLEDGKVTSTRSLNRDCAVLLKGEDFTGDTAEEACLRFASLADGKHLIGADGIRLHMEGGDAGLLDGLQSALSQKFGQYTVGGMDETSFSQLLAGYNESEMGDFEDWLEREFENKRSDFEAEIFGLLETYRDDLDALDVSDSAAVAAFNQTYLKLGEDLTFEDGDETKAELLEEYTELTGKLEKNPARVLDELFKEFIDELEDVYEDTLSPDRADDHDDDSDDDDHDHDVDDDYDDRDDRDDDDDDD